MKKLIIPLVLLVLIIIELVFMDDIKKIATDFINNRPDLIIQASNEYARDYDFMYVSRSKDYVPYSKKDVRNIFYSMINNGWDDFTFYCPSEYEECIQDVQELSSDDILLTNINNFAAPYNSFSSIATSYDDSG